MPIKYYKLFDILQRRGMKKTDLLTIANLSRRIKTSAFYFGEYVVGLIVLGILQPFAAILSINLRAVSKFHVPT